MSQYVVCLSVCLPVCLSLRLPVTFRYRDHIGLNTSKIISRLKLKVPAHIDPNMGDVVQREHPQIRVE